jgi:hypothetical protein
LPLPKKPPLMLTQRRLETLLTATLTERSLLLLL